MATFVNDTLTETGGGGDVLLTDHTGETGATWTAHSSNAGTLQIVKSLDAVRGTGASQTHLYYASGAPAGANVSVTAVFRVASNEASHTIGIAFRIDTGANTYYFAQRDAFVPNWALNKLVAGSETNLDTYVGDGSTATDYTVVASVTGDALTVTINGVERMAMTDTDIAGSASSRIGIVGYDQATASTGWQIYSISADDIGGATNATIVVPNAATATGDAKATTPALTLLPAVVDAAAAAASPTPTLTVQPAVVNANAAAAAPAVVVSATRTVTEATGTGDAKAPGAAITVLPSVVDAVGAAPAPTPAIAVLPAVSDAAAVAAAPTIVKTGNIVINGVAATGTGTAHAPGPLIEITATLATGTGSATAPLPTLTVLPGAATGTSTGPTPTPALTFTPTPATGDGAGHAPLPILTVLPGAAAATGLAVAPVVQGGALSATVTATIAAATAEAHRPMVYHASYDGDATGWTYGGTSTATYGGTASWTYRNVD